MKRPPPAAPCPDRIRKPTSGFGWIDARLLHERWLAEMGADATAALVLLAIAADARGVSYFSRGGMAASLGCDVARIDRALARLRELKLIAHRPWRPGERDGVWQVLSLPERAARSGPTPLRQVGTTASAGDVLRSLGLLRKP